MRVVRNGEISVLFGVGVVEGSEQRVSSQVSRIVQLLTRDVNDEYASIAIWQRELSEAVRELVIERVTPALNRQLVEMPQDTLLEKRELCRWLNRELRDRLNLAIRCPKTGEPAILHAGVGNRPAEGRFEIELVAGNARRRTRSSLKLFPFELRDAVPRKESIGRYWAERSGDKSGQGSEIG